MKSVASASRLNPEIGACFLIWTGSVFYSIYKLKLASDEVEHTQDIYGDFSDGFLDKKKDVADFEWLTFKHSFVSLAPWLTFNFFVSEYLRATERFRCLRLFQIAISICYVLSNFKATVLVILFSQPIAFQIIGKLRSKRCVWICEIAFLFSLHTSKTISLEYIASNELQRLQVIISFAWINLRCCSYHLDLIDGKVSGDFVSVLAYCLYLPCLYTGPVVQYQQFEACWQTSAVAFRTRIRILTRDLLRFLFWMFATEVFLHFVYVNAISFRPQLVDNFDAWTRCGLCYSMGQFFHLKYVVLYGISTSLAKAENITVPNTPKCIGRIHLYSDMWKYFDSGLHTFLFRYIYVPVLKILQSYPFHKAQAAAVCFLFVFVWHDMQWNIFVWATLNYMGVMAESVFNWTYKQHWKDNYDDYLSPVWKTRLGCLLAVPLLAFSAVSSTYLFAGVEIGNIFFKHLVQGDAKSTLVLLLALYCCCQFSNHIKKVEVTKAKTK